MTNIGFIILIFCLWNVIGIVVAALFMEEVHTSGYTYFNYNRLNPIYIYRNTRCNIFGTICLTILANLLCPVLSICYWVYKLCTVGRK